MPIAEERPAVEGDIVTIDYRGTVDGVAFSGGTGTDLDVEIGGPGFIPGFTENLAGLAVGETKSFGITFPEEYASKDVAGKAADFTVTAKALKQAVVPALDDGLAEKLGFDKLDEVRGALTRQVQSEYDRLSRMRIKRELLDALAERFSFAVPESMVEGEFQQIWQRVESERKEGRQDDDDRGKPDDQLRGEYRAIAERRVRLGLAIAEIGRTNQIVVTPDELTRAIRQEAARYPGEEQKVVDFFRKTPQAVDGLRGPIFEDKVVDFLLELAKVTERTVAPEELLKDPETPPTDTPQMADAAA